MPPKEADFCRPFKISEEDILEAMKDIHGYLDISPGVFQDREGGDNPCRMGKKRISYVFVEKQMHLSGWNSPPNQEEL